MDAGELLSVVAVDGAQLTRYVPLSYRLIRNAGATDRSGSLLPQVKGSKEMHRTECR